MSKQVLFLWALTAVLIPKGVRACCGCRRFLCELAFIEEVSAIDKLYVVNKFHAQHELDHPVGKHKELADFLKQRKPQSLTNSKVSAHRQIMKRIQRGLHTVSLLKRGL